MCVCPAGTTQYDGHCYACTLSFCTSCQTDNICSTCSNPFVPVDNGASCGCVQGFVLVNNNCVCPAGQV